MKTACCKSSKFERDGNMVRCLACGKYCHLMDKIDEQWQGLYAWVDNLGSPDVNSWVNNIKSQETNYCVMVEGGDLPECWHSTFESARKEAKRLAEKEMEKVTILKRLEEISPKVSFHSVKFDEPCF